MGLKNEDLYKLNPFKMKLFKSKPVIHHFKVHFPIPSSRVQSCINKIQQLSCENTEAIFLSLNGFCQSPQIAQTLHNSFQITNDKWKIPVYTFLEEFTTSLSYFSSTCGIVSANPYCIIGDIGTTHKTYTNIEKLLKFFNIKLDLLSCHQNQQTPWNSLTAPTEQQKQLSQKWINAVEQNMIKTVSERRRIPLETIRTLKNKVFTPQEALANNLIDHIQTVDEFKEIHYPQVKVQEHLFATTSKTPNIGGSEIKVLMKIQEVLSMPKVALFALEDPMNQCIRDFTEMIKVRIESPQKLEELDVLLGSIFDKIQLKMEDDSCFLF